jgi:putative ubiquitin-RnfH superfamily antitoxin RatB of RatAB toxin-antitoxin module
MRPEDAVQIEVVYALPEEQVIVALTVPPGTTVARAVERSGLVGRFPELAGAAKLGVFGQLVSSDTLVTPGDRVEVYRPLVADPKQARRRRAAGKAAPRI